MTMRREASEATLMPDIFDGYCEAGGILLTPHRRTITVQRLSTGSARQQRAHIHYDELHSHGTCGAPDRVPLRYSCAYHIVAFITGLKRHRTWTLCMWT